MEKFEYMKSMANIIPEDVMEQYNLARLVDDGWVCIDIIKGMYGLPQSGLLAIVKLIKHIEKYGYHLTKLTPRLWRHDSK